MCIENISQASIAQLPNRQAMFKFIRRKRNEVNQVPENLRSIHELELPHKYKMYNLIAKTEEHYFFSWTGERATIELLFLEAKAA